MCRRRERECVEEEEERECVYEVEEERECVYEVEEERECVYMDG